MIVGRTKKPSLSSALPPATTVSASSSFARSRTPDSLEKDLRSMTAPMKFEKSVTSPIGSDSVVATRSSFSCDQTLRGTYAREAAEHFCPWNSNAPRTRAVFSTSTSADACATTKSLPPVSPTMRG
jgi:hypothetical protein